MRKFCYYLIIIGTLSFITSIAYSQGSEGTLEFDGVDDVVYVPYSPSFDMSDNFTVEFWWTPSKVYDNQSQYGNPGLYNNNAIVSMSTPTTEEIGYAEASDWAFFLFTSNLLGSNDQGRLRFGTYGGNIQTTNDVWLPGVWYHVAVAYESSTNATFYVNGVVDNYEDSFDAGAVDGLAENPLLIGRGWYNPVIDTNYFDGRVDELRIWSVVRTQQQIQDNMCLRMTGNENNLVAYYRFDELAGTTLTDLTTNGNDGTLLDNDPNNDDDSTLPQWRISGAAIGDFATNRYVTDWSSVTFNLAHPNGDDFTISSVTGSPNGIQLYLVNEAPNVTTPPTGFINISPLRYWGVYVIGAPGFGYTGEYNYEGHPGIGDEIDQESLSLATRLNNASTEWTGATETPNTTNNTITLTGLADTTTEFILGSLSSENPLPVELTSFNATLVEDKIQLEWKTFSEINNAGFEIWRSVDNNENFQLLSSFQNNPKLVGAGNSSTTHKYDYLDQDVQSGHTYCYQLWDVSFSGERENHTPVSVSIKKASVTAESIVLYQNYPNPFNPLTYIRFQINNIDPSYGSSIPVYLNIYDLLGRKVKTLLNQNLNIGDYTLSWNGTDDLDQNVASGSYVYMLQIGDQKITKRLILVR